MYTLLIVFYVLVAVALVGLVLIQQGKGADAGAAFGSGASGTVFGSRGSANFLTRATAVLATVFFLLSLALAYVVHGRSAQRSVVEEIPERTAPAQPASTSPVAPATTAPVVPPPAAASAPVTDAKPDAAKPQPEAPAAPAPKVPQ